MSRLKSRLDRLDGGASRNFDIPITFYAVENSPEWPNEAGDFATSQFGVFYRNHDEGIETFLMRVQEKIGPPRPLVEMTDEELEISIASYGELFAKIKPKFRDAVRKFEDDFDCMPNFKITWEDDK